MNKQLLVGGIVLGLLIIGGFVYFGGSSSDSSTSSTSQPKKDNFSQVTQFALRDYDGNLKTPKDFDDKILVINMWATWCPFCVDELPDFATLQSAFPEDIAVIAINRAEPQSIAQDYTDRFGLTDDMNFLLDPDDSFYKSIGGFSMPETLFVDKKGNVRLHKRGPLELQEMKERVEEILSS